MENLHASEEVEKGNPTISVCLDIDDEIPPNNRTPRQMDLTSPTVDLMTVSDLSVMVESPRDPKMEFFDPRLL